MDKELKLKITVVFHCAMLMLSAYIAIIGTLNPDTIYWAITVIFYVFTLVDSHNIYEAYKNLKDFKLGKHVK